MTFVLNKCFGGFSISQFAMEALGVDTKYPDLTADMAAQLASLIAEHGSEKCSGPYARLEVVKIPDECTDYEITDYDGIEQVTYVLDGKLYHA